MLMDFVWEMSVSVYIKIAYQVSEGTEQALGSKERIGAERQSCEVGEAWGRAVLGQYVLFEGGFMTPGSCVFTADALRSVCFSGSRVFIFILCSVDWENLLLNIAVSLLVFWRHVRHWKFETRDAWWELP